MSHVAVRIVRPPGTLRLSLGSSPVRTTPVELQARLLRGANDVTVEAVFAWRLSWRGTYRTYRVHVGDGATVTVPFTVGGHLLTVDALYEGQRYRASVPTVITGTNPSRGEVANKIGADDVLKAICWAESTWRQFDRGGIPLRNPDSSARGIAQIIERYWADSNVIRHNDYARMAWQWDYSIEAARDILVQYSRRVSEDKPAAVGADQLGWLFAAYHRGPTVLDRDAIPKSAKDYVTKILALMGEKPWEE
jgi:hypothetical protein